MNNAKLDFNDFELAMDSFNGYYKGFELTEEQKKLWYTFFYQIEKNIFRKACRNYVTNNIYNPTIAGITNEINKLIKPIESTPETIFSQIRSLGSNPYYTIDNLKQKLDFPPYVDYMEMIEGKATLIKVSFAYKYFMRHCWNLSNWDSKKIDNMFFSFKEEYNELLRKEQQQQLLKGNLRIGG